MARILSTEDGNTNVTSITVARQKVFSDIDLSFENKSAGDIFKKTDAASVKQSVLNIVSTNKLEKPFESDYGANLRALLFEGAHGTLGYEIKKEIRSVIYVYEPRAEIDDIQVRLMADNNSLHVTLTFRVVNQPEIQTVTTYVSRLR
mgnify:CR=1 FL=1